MRYYHNPAFRLKMLLFVIALVFHFALQIRVARQAPEQLCRCSCGSRSVLPVVLPDMSNFPGPIYDPATYGQTTVSGQPARLAFPQV